MSSTFSICSISKSENIDPISLLRLNKTKLSDEIYENKNKYFKLFTKTNSKKK